MTYRLLLLADEHVASTVAPWPDVSFPDGGEYRPSKYQRWLNRCWDRMLEEALSYDHFDCIVNLGDTLDGNNPRASLVTDRVDCQIAAAVELLSPVRELAEQFYMVAGTNWHVGKGAEYETSVARELDATTCPETNHPVWPFLLLNMDGVIAHFAHHTGTVRNIRYEPTGLWGALMNLRQEYDKAYGRLAPDVRCIFRAHRHRMMHIQKGPWHAASVCAWQLHTDFSLKVAGDSVPETGFAVVEVEDGEVRVRQVTFPPPLPHVEG